MNRHITSKLSDKLKFETTLGRFFLPAGSFLLFSLRIFCWKDLVFEGIHNHGDYQFPLDPQTLFFEYSSSWKSKQGFGYGFTDYLALTLPILKGFVFAGLNFLGVDNWLLSRLNFLLPLFLQIVTAASLYGVVCKDIPFEYRWLGALFYVFSSSFFHITPNFLFGLAGLQLLCWCVIDGLQRPSAKHMLLSAFAVTLMTAMPRSFFLFFLILCSRSSCPSHQKFCG